jgi:serine/threonine protein kinase/formylglycine-generating enzyme required for sulfatase activity
MFCTNCGNNVNAGASRCDNCGTPLGVQAGSSGAAALPPDTGRTAEAGTPSTSVITGAPTSANASTGGGGPVEFGKLVGRILGGRYQLNEFIGSGGMGEIYRARRTHIGDTVAVKVLRADVVSNEKTRQRFYREARAAAMLHHPNAVVIHDFGEDTDGLAYIVMELLVGRSLRQLLADEGAFDPLRAYGVTRQACAALEAGHRSGIVHRDVKPDNIILLSQDEDSDHVKILDFGIAKLRDKALDTLSVENNLTNIGTVIGTPNYMSPEQCQGEEADARSDIYSLGVVMYEMLTGVMPFIAKTPTGVAIKHVTEKPRSLRELQPALPAEVEAVVLHALEKLPEARPQSMLELAREFAAALKQAGVTTAFERLGDRSGIIGQKTARPVNLDTPRTDEMQGTQRTLVIPKSDSAADSFQTSLTPVTDLSTTPPQAGQRLTEVLPHQGSKTVPKLVDEGSQTAEAAPENQISFDTVLTEAPPTGTLNRDEYKTMLPGEVSTDIYKTSLPEDAGATSFETLITEVPLPPRDPYATLIPLPPDNPANAGTEVFVPPAPQSAQHKAQLFEGTELLDARPTNAEPPAAKAGQSGGKKDHQRKDKSKGKAGAQAAAVASAKTAPAVIELPDKVTAFQPETGGAKSGSQKIMLVGIAAVVLAAAIGAWAWLTKGNEPPAAEQPRAAASPVASVNPPVAAPQPPAGMIYIPGGEFKVGRADGEVNEQPVHTVILAPFYIDRTEVTNEDYAKFIEATGYLLPPSWQGQRYPAGTDKLPVTDVTWEDANEYAKWAAKRLPTEAEWELAARGSEGQLYPWGNAWQEDVANVAKDEKEQRQLAPVGTFLRGQSFYGVLDLVGNAWEWTASDYQGYNGTTLELPADYRNLKVIRGCSFGCTVKQATATYRRGWPGTRQDWPDGVSPNYTQTGFRCAQDVPQK